MRVVQCLLKWLLLTIFVTTTASAQQKLQPSEAKAHVGRDGDGLRHRR